MLQKSLSAFINRKMSKEYRSKENNNTKKVLFKVRKRLPNPEPQSESVSPNGCSSKITQPGPNNCNVIMHLLNNFRNLVKNIF